jgi:hypothetical protein
VLDSRDLEVILALTITDLKKSRPLALNPGPDQNGAMFQCSMCFLFISGCHRMIVWSSASFCQWQDPRNPRLIRMFIEYRNEILEDMILCEIDPAQEAW